MITKLIRKIISDKNDEYTFYANDGHDMNFQDNFGLYIHVPFCQNMCPYCPYFKIKYQQELADKYYKSLLEEINKYNKQIKHKNCTSLYIGGGTPTLVINNLENIINKIKNSFIINQEIALETTPSDLDKSKLNILKNIGVNFLSLGIQSFQDKYLNFLQRNYNSNLAQKILEQCKSLNFDTLNIDMIFAFPGQTIMELNKDLEISLSYEPKQITFYPLFTFPYTTIGKYKKLNKLKMPGIFTRKKMYYHIYDFYIKKGYIQTSVWSFNKKGSNPYSSVTREKYLGLGPGAGSFDGKGFYFNTFSVEEYIKKIKEGIPVSLKMDVSPRMSKIHHFYWKLYETQINISEYQNKFGNSIYKDFGKILKIMEIFKLIIINKDKLVLTKSGSLRIHLIQNYFALNYVNKIWSKSNNNPWPKKILI